MRIISVLLLYAAVLLAFPACDGCSSPSGYQGGVSGYDPYAGDGLGGPEEGFVYADEDYATGQNDYSDFHLTGVMEPCRHCMAYGSVMDPMTGIVSYCKFCGGMRVVDAAVNQLPDDAFDNMPDFGFGSDADYGGGYREEIEREIARLEEDIEMMENQLEYIEGGIQSNYLRQQIIEARNEIRKLQYRLNNL